MRVCLTRVSLLSLCLLAAAAMPAQAQSATDATVPRLVRVTSSFQPADGKPPASVETMTLSIYSEERGGAPLWQETQSVAIGPDGRFTLLLGSTHLEGLPLDLFAGGETRWLAIHVERPGEGEPGRVLLVSVPYALHASDAETLGGRPPSAYAFATSDASATSTPRSPSSFATAGTSNFIGRFINSTDLGNSAMYDNFGKIGVGTTAPVDTMHVKFSDAYGVYTGYAVQNVSGSPSSYSGMLFYDQNGTLGQFQGFNNATHEYRINNIAQDANAYNGSINFMIGSLSKFLVGTNGDISIATSRIMKGGVRFLGDYEFRNTGVGLQALNSVSTSTQSTSNNTAIGTGALQSMTAGGSNVAVGDSALMNPSANLARSIPPAASKKTFRTWAARAAG